MRRVKTVVLPDPAPATTRHGPQPWHTASFWAAFSRDNKSLSPLSGRAIAVFNASSPLNSILSIDLSKSLSGKRSIVPKRQKRHRGRDQLGKLLGYIQKEAYRQLHSSKIVPYIRSA